VQLQLALSAITDSLSPDDEIINKRNNFGNSPLEIAALYSTKEVVDKLKAKGATGDIGSDYWAIRGGNLAVWSDTVPLDRPELVHWAAYNDLPEVLEKFRQKNVSLTTLDQNGSTPIDIAVVNKSYRAFKYLLGLGLLPNP
jgi:ankyrin repeat protein